MSSPALVQRKLKYHDQAAALRRHRSRNDQFDRCRIRRQGADPHPQQGGQRPDAERGPDRCARQCAGGSARPAFLGHGSREHARRIQAPDGHRASAGISRERDFPATGGARGRGAEVAARGRRRPARRRARARGHLGARAVRAAAERGNVRGRAAAPASSASSCSRSRSPRRSPPAGARTAAMGRGWSTISAAAPSTSRCSRRATASCAWSATTATTSSAGATSIALS